MEGVLQILPNKILMVDGEERIVPVPTTDVSVEAPSYHTGKSYSNGYKDEIVELGEFFIGKGFNRTRDKIFSGSPAFIFGDSTGIHRVYFSRDWGTLDVKMEVSVKSEIDIGKGVSELHKLYYELVSTFPQYFSQGSRRV